MRLKRGYLMLIAAMLSPMSAMAIQVPNLTGTWEGKLVCSGIKHQAGKIKQTYDKVKLYITQTSNTLSIDRDDGTGLDAYAVDYTGYVIADLNKPLLKGQVALTHCSSTNNIFSGGYSELSNLSVAADSVKAKGSLKGASTYSIPATQNTVLEVGGCKWQFKLIDATDPLVAPGCF